MLHRWLSIVAPGITAATPAVTPRHAPYGDPSIDQLYNLLFCDEPGAFAPRGEPATPWQQTLYGRVVDAGQVRRLASDEGTEARVRALAFHWLQRHGHQVPGRQVLGVVIEVPIDHGLDVLAAYADGGVRYINHTGAASIVDCRMPTLAPVVQRLLEASQAVVERIGPWVQPRLAPPQRNVRMTFIASDGLYFGQGPMETLLGDAMAGPVLQAGTELLQRVVDLTRR